ncbi:hypothetical protein FRB90_009706, partial [Tulasnella sp. 427]
HTLNGTEINYIANCIHGDYPVSHIAYYINIDNSHDGQLPTALSDPYRDKNGDWITWEGQQQNITFPDRPGVPIIETDIGCISKKCKFTLFAGSIRRTFDLKPFICFRDNDRELFSTSLAPKNGVPQNLTCNSLYYCASNNK